jgi:hypothetical protein
MRSAVNGLCACPAGAVALNAVTFLSMAPGRPASGTAGTVPAVDAPVALPDLACITVAAAAVLRLR